MEPASCRCKDVVRISRHPAVSTVVFPLPGTLNIPSFRITPAQHAQNRRPVPLLILHIQLPVNKALFL